MSDGRGGGRGQVAGRAVEEEDRRGEDREEDSEGRGEVTGRQEQGL